jgi:hypothetical protein
VKRVLRKSGTSLLLFFAICRGVPGTVSAEEPFRPSPFPRSSSLLSAPSFLTSLGGSEMPSAESPGQQSLLSVSNPDGHESGFLNASVQSGQPPASSSAMSDPHRGSFLLGSGQVAPSPASAGLRVKSRPIPGPSTPLVAVRPVTATTLLPAHDRKPVVEDVSALQPGTRAEKGRGSFLLWSPSPVQAAEVAGLDPRFEPAPVPVPPKVTAIAAPPSSGAPAAARLHAFRTACRELWKSRAGELLH